jgi:hypothetical protein
MAKFDGVIEAVRYHGGQIQLVRAYERRGATFSDRVILDRAELLERLKKGRRFVTGQRNKFLASTFEVGKSVNVVGRDGGTIVTGLDQHHEDRLEGVPNF